MNKVNVNKTGLVFAILLGGLHLIWAILIVVGIAQPLMDFIFKIHMLNNVFIVSSFNLGLAVVLIIVTAVIGYIIGVVLAAVWNYLHK